MLPVTVEINQAYAWRTTRDGPLTVHAIGHCLHLNALVGVLKARGAKDIDAAAELLRREPGQFGCIVEGPGFVFACVDRVRAYPVFYASSEESCVVSNCARTVSRRAGLGTPDESALLELSMAGYVSGRETVYRDLYQLQASEFLIWRDGKPDPRIHRYYRYLPRPSSGADEPALIDGLGTIIDRIMKRAIERANGAPIWVPLSGGLDSRLVLSKLVEHGYDRVQSFSYGVRGNHEAATARRMARKLGVPWFHLSARPGRAQELYSGDRRREYAAFADGLCAAPSYTDFEPFHRLVEREIIPPDAVVINGQTGDFITGGHIPRRLIESPSPVIDDLLAAIIDKHYSLWLSLKTPENLHAIENKIRSLLPDPSPNLSGPEQLCAWHECWEWQERQCKLVVNGQRVYDYFGLRWELPLWDGELMDFWETVPFSMKFDQALYTRYLRAYNFKGVFDRLRDDADTWPPRRRWVQWCARFLGLVSGQTAKEDYYNRMYYYGTYHNQFALFGRDYYLSHYRDARGVVSFIVSHWLSENGLPPPIDHAGGLASQNSA